MTTETKVGAFVLVSALIFTSMVVYLANAQFHRGSVPYRTYLRYAGGLEPGAPVLFGGIKVGRVTGVSPWQSDPTRIEILMELKEGTPVNGNSVAKLGSVSVVSEPALQVSTGSNDAPRIPAGGAIPSQETISFDEIAAKLSAVAGNANELMDQVRGELGGVSHDARQLLQNVNSLTADERPKIDRIANQIVALTKHADDTVENLKPVIAHADTAIQNINGTVEDARKPLQTDLSELQNTLLQAKALLADVQVLIRANDSKVDDTMENLRDATDNLDQLTNELKQRPWSLVRVKQPKARQVPQ